MSPDHHSAKETIGLCGRDVKRVREFSVVASHVPQRDQRYICVVTWVNRPLWTRTYEPLKFPPIASARSLTLPVSARAPCGMLNCRWWWRKGSNAEFHLTAVQPSPTPFLSVETFPEAMGNEASMEGEGQAGQPGSAVPAAAAPASISAPPDSGQLIKPSNGAPAGGSGAGPGPGINR